MTGANQQFKGATSRILHLEKAGKFFQVSHPKSILISLIRNHPCLVLVYYYFFGVFLP